MLGFNEKAEAITVDDNKVSVSYIAIEYASEGELFDWVTKTGKFNEDESRYFFHQLIEGLEYLHKKGYYHRDIKPENLVLSEDFKLKLIDFGFATKDITSTKRRGTIQYMAPEVLTNKEYRCEQADLYGAAITLFNLATQHTPFFKASESDGYYSFIANDDWEGFWKAQKAEDLSKNFKDLFRKMIYPDPGHRLSLSEIKEHPWYAAKTPSHDDMHLRLVARKKEVAYNSSKKVAESAPEKLKKNKKLATKFYKVKDGDELVDTIVEFARKRGYEFIKSTEYFQVDIKLVLPGYIAQLKANVLKRSNEDERCIQLVLYEGDKTQFKYILKQLEKYCDSKYICKKE